MPYNYGGYPVGGYYSPPPMPDQLAQLRGAQMPVQPLQNPQPFGGNQMLQNPQQVTQPVQPMSQVPQVQQQSMSGPVYVNGEAGAKGYIIAPNQTVMLIDADPDAQTFWLKSADASGMPSMRTFDYVERLNATKTQAPALSPAVEYVTRADFDLLSARADALAKELEALKVRKAPIAKKPVKESESDE